MATDEYLTVLIVARPSRIRDGLHAIMRSMPWVACVIWADNELAALQTVERVPPSLIFLDINLPNNEAWETLKALYHHSSHIRRVVITNTQDQKRLAYAYGADAALLKGFTTETLHKTIFSLFPQFETRHADPWKTSKSTLTTSGMY